MPLPPSPMHYHCPACSWSTTTAPLSDALRPGDHYSSCPHCAHSPLQVQACTAQQAILGLLKRLTTPKR